VRSKRLMEYKEDDYLLLSGLQHFAFCRRQWALIHIENQWVENYRTTDGELMHRNAHDVAFLESRGILLIQHAIRIYSSTLGVSGECDVLEYHKDANGIRLPKHDGLWQPFPVEYKRGKPGTTEGDALQLCGQALCLEEMLCCSIPFGALYYGETRHRETVTFSPELRKRVREFISEMHELYSRGYTPKVKPIKGCQACSLKELCLPKILKTKSVSIYLKEKINEQ